MTATTICSFSGLLPERGCVHQRQELFITGTEPQQFCTYHQAQEPWHHLNTPYAGWLRQRYAAGGEGRYRLAGFGEDLERLFPGEGQDGATGPGAKELPGPGARQAGENPDPISLPGAGTPNQHYLSPGGDNFVLQPPAEAIRLTVKASCRVPFPRVTWFVDGQEEAVTGPPYEIPLELGRGKHRLMVVGPDGIGDAIGVVVQ